MDLMRIGGKLISRNKISRMIDRILEMRVQGASQQDIATELSVDRAFISRLESIGEVRKGGRLALIAFPVANFASLKQVAQEEGVEFSLVLTDQERWDWVSDSSGAEIINRLLDMISELKEYDAVIFIGSDMRIRMVEAILGRDKVVGMQIGTSPIREDKVVNVDEVRSLIKSLQAYGPR